VDRSASARFSPRPPPPHTWEPLLRLALAEDIRSGDVSTAAVIPAEATGQAEIEAREPLLACGLFVAAAAFERVEPRLRFQARLAEGERAAAGRVLATLEGPLHGILAAERTALNFLGRLCGIASFTARFVEAVKGTGVAILDTRKTLPGWRALDKYAVAVGGGVNHRFALDDALLVKDNHIAAAGGVAAAVRAAKERAPSHLQLQVEVESLDDALAAAEAGADALLLDNRSPAELRGIARALASRIVLEASGGVTLDNVREVAETGVHRISIGALTRSVPAADVALEVRAAGSSVRA
jgi:nicotinate-nucleotide pyrophosphorylase (carboxylating)